MSRLLSLSFVVLGMFFVPSLSKADIICFDLSSNGLAGIALASTGTYTEGGLTITVSSVGGAFSNDSDGAGVSGGNDGTEVDGGGESLTFTITYSGSMSGVELLEVDLNNQSGGPTDGDEAIVNSTEFSQVNLSDGTPNYTGGGTDTWTPSPSIPFSSGGSITFSADPNFVFPPVGQIDANESYAVQKLVFESGVPEPGSLAALGLLAVGFGLRRRKRAA